MTYNRDMQEDKVPLFEAADAGGRFARDGARGDRIGAPDSRAAARRRRRELGSGHRPGRGPGARRHAVSHRRIRSWAASFWKACAAGRKPADWTPEEIARFAPEFTVELAALVDPKQGMRSREIAGGTGPAAVAAALAEAEERLNRMITL